MVKRYEIVETYGMVRCTESEDGAYILASDFDRMRRRLVVKLLRERNEVRYQEAMELARRGHYDEAKLIESRGIFFSDLADAIERGERLEYFERLGSDKK